MLSTRDGDYTSRTEESTPLISKSMEYLKRIEPSSTVIFWHEMRVVRRSSLPILESLLLEYSFHFVQIGFAGHISTLALAAVSLGSMTANVTGISMLRGLASALDTMLPSAHTSARPELVALWSQRMIVLLFISMIPILVVWLHMESILLCLNQDPEIAKLAGLYLRWLAMGLPGAGLREVSRRYFQCQGYFSAQTHIMLIVAPLNVLLNYMLVLGPEPFNLGFIGAPISVAISYTLVPIISILYCVFLLPNSAWYPISTEIFTDLGDVARLGVCGIGQIASEWWAWEILALLAAFLGPVAIASQSILLTLGSTTYQVGFAVACAAGVRVGHHLGAMDHRRARGAANASLVLGLMISISLGVIYMLFRQSWARMLSNDPDVIANVASIIPMIALFQIVEGNSCVTAGLLRATSRQDTSALLNISAFYLLGLPFGSYLVFIHDWRLPGLWLGLTLALVCCSVVGTTLCLKTDWQGELTKVQLRYGKASHKLVDEETSLGV